MAVLTLDIGLKMGWALQRSDGSVVSGVKLLEGAQDGTRFRAWRNWLTDTKNTLRGDELEGIVFERVDFMAPDNGVFAIHMWGALWGVMEGWAAAFDIPTRGLAVATIKKLVTGNGRAKKPEVIAAVQQRWPEVTDDNEADALAVLIAAGKKFA